MHRNSTISIKAAIDNVKNIKDSTNKTVIIHLGTNDLDNSKQRIDSVIETLKNTNSLLASLTLRCQSPSSAQQGQSDRRLPSTDIGLVRSLLGMTNFLSRFVPEYASIVKPLRDLTRRSTPWAWGKKQNEAFDAVKKALSHEKNLSYL
ncbi:hypothetical protein Bbelb_187350 [Branchiostoma belcheri]|nr:hypothetical protein Bbelb_187350 [Branchiostoma belcheri]